MKIIVTRWLECSETCPQIGNYMTAVTIASPRFSTAFTFPGQLRKRRALELARRRLVEDGHDGRFLVQFDRDSGLATLAY